MGSTKSSGGISPIRKSSITVIAINGWNRLAISFRTLAGTYRPREAGAAIS
jgi:hypothetical protein